MEKMSYKNCKLKISAPTWNEQLELPEGSYSISDIIIYLQGYFQYIFKKVRRKKCGVNPLIKYT